MTRRKILIIDGHPDPDPSRFVHALAAAYAKGAAAHDVRTLRIADLDFPILRSPKEWMEKEPSDAIAGAQEELTWADHVVILYPLWLGDVPALLKGFLEQALRPGFAFRYVDGGLPEKLLKGRSARLIVTMGMPSIFYTLYYRAHSVKSLQRNILNFVGISPVRRTIIGMVEGDEAKRRAWLEDVEGLGAAGI